jgi:hypothetical protein
MNAGFLSAESEFARHAAFAERKATILRFSLPKSNRPRGQVLLRRATPTLAHPPFSHGIVAFNGWPLNALRRDNHYEKAHRQKLGYKTAFSSGKRDLAARDDFRFQENRGKHPY